MNHLRRAICCLSFECTMLFKNLGTSYLLLVSSYNLSPKFLNCIVWKFNCNDSSTCWPAVSVCKNCPGTVLPPPPPPSKESKFWWEGCSKPWPGFFSSLKFLVKKLISHENYPALIIYIRNYKDKQMKTYVNWEFLWIYFW